MGHFSSHEREDYELCEHARRGSRLDKEKSLALWMSKKRYRSTSACDGLYDYKKTQS